MIIIVCSFSNTIIGNFISVYSLRLFYHKQILEQQAQIIVLSQCLVPAPVLVWGLEDLSQMGWHHLSRVSVSRLLGQHQVLS